MQNSKNDKDDQITARILRGSRQQKIAEKRFPGARDAGNRTQPKRAVGFSRFTMAVTDALFTVALSVLLPPFLLVLVTVLVLASLGKSLGLRQKYVQFLLKVFEVSSEGKRIFVIWVPFCIYVW